MPKSSAEKQANARYLAKLRARTCVTRCRYCETEFVSPLKLDGSGPRLNLCPRHKNRRGCPEKRKATRRRRYQQLPVDERVAKSNAWKQRNPDKATIARRERKRRLRAKLRAQGLSCRGKPLVAAEMRSQWERNAREAWQYWLNVRAPDSWIAAYHEARGKPWLNPRLSVADKFRLRYAHDPDLCRPRTRSNQRKAIRQSALWRAVGAQCRPVAQRREECRWIGDASRGKATAT